VPFDDLTSGQIALAQQTLLASITVTFRGLPMTITFATMQASVKSGSIFAAFQKFPVKKSDAYEEALLNSLKELDSANDRQVSWKINNDKINIKASFIALKEDAQIGLQFYEKKIRELTCEEKVDLDTEITDTFSEELDQIGLKFSVEVRKQGKSIVLAGLVRPVSQALKAVMELLRNNATTNYIKRPDHWTPQPENVIDLVDVPPATTEWKDIEVRMKATLPGVKILHIQRVQNFWQYQKYIFLRDRLAKRGASQELLLFHGTRTNNPTLIYKGDDGFDMRHSQQGYWGKASYFAMNASYSHTYAFDSPEGKQMFSARVAIGKSMNMTTDQSLIKPPEGYDSVSGITHGSVVHMVYENGRAYPEHLITYQI